jgi:hypothetical protein
MLMVNNLTGNTKSYTPVTCYRILRSQPQISRRKGRFGEQVGRQVDRMTGFLTANHAKYANGGIGFRVVGVFRGLTNFRLEHFKK